jgi:hypothetical protein
MPDDAAALPEGYTSVHTFVVTGRRALVWMNLTGALVFLVGLAVVLAWRWLDEQLGRPLALSGLPRALPEWVYLPLALATLAAHEGLHGAAIRLLGHRPRFGAKLTRLVLYTTAEVYFTRAEYLIVTLAPIVGLSIAGLVGMLLAPAGMAPWLGVLTAMNAAASVGDLWMAAVTASFPPQARFRDREDGMSVFMPCAS